MFWSSAFLEIPRTVRAFQALLLIVSLLLAQAGFARASYVLPSGESCVTCPTLQDALQVQPKAGERWEVAAAHGDCHDCCTLTAKSSDAGDARIVADGFASHLDTILPEPVLVGVPALRTTRPCVPVFVPAHPPNGPPALSASRAPPAPAIGP